MNKLLEVVQHIFTARDGDSYSLTKLVGIAAAVVMIGKFAVGTSTDFSGFGTGISLLMAALAAKYFVEDKEK